MCSIPGRFNRFALSSVALLLVLGCGPSSGGSNTPAKRDPTRFERQADESLTTDQYVRLVGLQQPDRIWNAENYANARTALAKLVSNEGHRRLPRYRSERSGEMFARLTSPQNFEFVVDQDILFSTRLEQGMSMFEVGVDILQLYSEGFRKGQVRDSELVELFGSTLRQMAACLQLVEELLPKIDRNSPVNEERLKGLEQMRYAVALSVAGALQTLQQPDDYRLGERLRLIGYLQETVPKILPKISPNARTAALEIMEKMQSDPRCQDLQPQLGELWSKSKLTKPADE